MSQRCAFSSWRRIHFALALGAAIGPLALAQVANGLEPAPAGSHGGAPVPSTPSSLTPPQLTGMAAEGQVLVASAGSWSGTRPLRISYWWLRCDSVGCKTIVGERSASYVLTAADVGRVVFVAVTASNGGGTATAASDATGVVAAAPLLSLAPPTVAGTPAVGHRLTAAPGTWGTDGPIEIGYVWLRCDADGSGCASIDGASTAVYQVRPRDAGSRLAARVTASAGGSYTRDSAFTAVVPPPTPARIRPFPRVRIKGFFTSSGAVVQLMRVTAPLGASVAVTCRGSDCPFERRLERARPRLRLRALERGLRAGTRIEIRITQQARIGKYASFVVHAGRPPTRKDRCLMPGSARAVRCPADSDDAGA
jgi:hypothetical protein